MGEIDSSADHRDSLLDARKLLNEHRVEQYALFDRALLTLATGAIGLSLPLATFFASKGPVADPQALATAWVFLVLSLFCNLASFLTGARDAMREITHIDDELRTGEDTSDRNNPDRNLTSLLNYSAYATFGIGTVSLLIFAYGNVL